MKIKVVKCSNELLWYSKHIGEEFEVNFIEKEAYWTREKDGVYNCLNWIFIDDVIITEGNVN